MNDYARGVIFLRDYGSVADVQRSIAQRGIQFTSKAVKNQYNILTVLALR